MNPRKVLTLGFLLGFSLSGTAQVVIVNAQNPTSALSKAEVEQLFTGKSKNFPGGSAATPVDNAAARESFYKSLTGKSSDQIKAYWAKLEFTGMGKAPMEAANGKAVAEQVAKSPGSIGYVDKSEVTPGVKAVLTLQ